MERNTYLDTWGMLFPQARCCRGRLLKLSDPSQSRFASECPSLCLWMEWNEVDWVNLFLIISSCKISTRIPKLVEWIRIKG